MANATELRCALCGNADDVALLQGVAYCATASGCEDERLAQEEDALYPACCLCGNTRRRKRSYRYGNPSCADWAACAAERQSNGAQGGAAAMPRADVARRVNAAADAPILWCVACGARGLSYAALAADPACSARETCAAGGF